MVMVIGHFPGGSTVLGIVRGDAAVRRLARKFLMAQGKGAKVEYFPL